MEPTVCGGTDINPVITNTAELFEKIIILWKHSPRETDLEWGTGKVSLRNYNTQTQNWTMCGRQPQLEGKGWPEVATQVIFTETGYNTHLLLRTPSPPGTKGTVLCLLQMEAKVQMTVSWKMCFWGLFCSASDSVCFKGGTLGGFQPWQWPGDTELGQNLDQGTLSGVGAPGAMEQRV